jgi:uncharacterized membrane protein
LEKNICWAIFWALFSQNSTGHPVQIGRLERKTRLSRQKKFQTISVATFFSQKEEKLDFVDPELQKASCQVDQMFFSDKRSFKLFQSRHFFRKRRKNCSEAKLDFVDPELQKASCQVDQMFFSEKNRPVPY